MCWNPHVLAKANGEQKKKRERERKCVYVYRVHEGWRALGADDRSLYIAPSKKFDRAAQVAERQFPLDVRYKPCINLRAREKLFLVSYVID